MPDTAPEVELHMQVHVLEDFPTQAAQRFVSWCAAKISQQARIHVALTGGGTAKEFYEALARPEVRAGLDVRAIDFYEGDERPVPPSSSESNWGMAEAIFLDPAGVPAENRHRMLGEAEDLHAAAREYEHVLCEHLPRHGEVPAFDLLLLGMGANGHTASLFPETAALAERERLVVANPVPEIGMTRLTITYPMIKAAHAVWIIASGQEKAEAAYRAIELRDPLLPVTHVMPRSPLVWLLDQAAGSKLSHRLLSPLCSVSHGSDVNPTCE